MISGINLHVFFQRLERTPFNPEEAEWETKKVIDDYKFKLQKGEK